MPVGSGIHGFDEVVPSDRPPWRGSWLLRSPRQAGINERMLFSVRVTVILSLALLMGAAAAGAGQRRCAHRDASETSCQYLHRRQVAFVATYGIIFFVFMAVSIQKLWSGYRGRNISS